MIRTLWAFTVGCVSTLLFGGIAIFLSFVRFGRTDRYCDWSPRVWSRWILWASGVKVKVEGLERLDRKSPQIVVSNHQSWFDVFAVASKLPVRYRFVAKKELARIPVYGRAWRSCGHISVDRGDRKAAIESLAQATAEVQDQGLTMIMFAEGTRSPTGELQKFKKGAFVLGIQLQIPLVPVAIIGSRKVMPKGGWRVRPGEITIRIGKPIPTKGMSIRDRDRLLNTTRDAVAGLMAGSVAGASPAISGEAGPMELPLEPDQLTPEQ